MATSTIGTVRSALDTLISAQLSGINVFSFMPGDKAFEGAAGYEFVALGDVLSGTQDHLSFGGSREETFTMQGIVFVAKSGTGDAQSAAAEDRALVVLAGVENALRGDDTPGSVFHGEIAGYQVRNGTGDARAWSQVEFEIDIVAHI